MADYVTPEQMASFGHEFDALKQVDAITLLVTSASRLFDNLCEVDENFFSPYVPADPEVYTDRVFYGDNTAYLKLDPFVELDPTDPIVIDPDFDYDVPDYTAIDHNLVVLSRTKQFNFNEYGRYYRFRGWHDGVQITVSAKWGWSATPADVTLATMHLAFHLWRTADPAFAVISNADSSISVRTVPQVAQVVIDKYREKYSQRCLFA